MTAPDRLTYCDLCDVLGPPESATRADSLALHRALHQTSRAFSLALRPVTDVARNLMQSLRDLLGGDEAHIATHARPGDTRTRALRRTETTRRSAMHTAYRHKTRHRLPVHTEDTMTTDDPTYPEHFNPSPDSYGFDLYEQWETTGPDEYALLSIAATPMGMTLKPGDWILRRRWAPAGEPTTYNRARLL